jgi:hypothetical protein
VTRRPSLTALVAGIGLTALGALLELESTGRIALAFAYVGPAVVVLLGAVLLTSGIQSRSHD